MTQCTVFHEGNTMGIGYKNPDLHIEHELFCYPILSLMLLCKMAALLALNNNHFPLFRALLPVTGYIKDVLVWQGNHWIKTEGQKLQHQRDLPAKQTGWDYQHPQSKTIAWQKVLTESMIVSFIILDKFSSYHQFHLDIVMWAFNLKLLWVVCKRFHQSYMSYLIWKCLILPQVKHLP